MLTRIWSKIGLVVVLFLVAAPLVAAEANSETWVRVKPASGSYGWGETIDVEVWIEDVNAPVQTLPVIPVTALVQRGSLPVVFVIAPNGNTELRVVRTGAKVDHGRISVISGLSGGERVLNNPRPGMTSRSR